MSKFRDIYLVFAAFVPALIGACTKENSTSLPQSGGTEFVLATKAGNVTELGTTFRIMAYGSEPANHFICIASGTYSLQGNKFEDFTYLTASKLDDTGEIIQTADATQALAVPYEQIGKDFYISYISPGMVHTGGGFSTDLSAPFYCSDIQKTVINNYGKVEMNKELIDRRAKIGFRIYKDVEDKAIEITDFRIIGAGNIYWPATKQVTPNDTLQVTLIEAGENFERLEYECKGFDEMPFILSGIYAPKDTVAARILSNTADYAIDFTPTNLQDSGYLTAKFKLSVNGAGALEMTAPLTFNALTNSAIEILPLTSYIYNITVSETYIHTILEVTPLNSWEDVEFGFEIKDNSVRINLGNFEFSDWENVEWGDDNKEINSESYSIQ